MCLRLSCVFLLAGFAMFAADPAGLVIWPKGVAPGGKGAKFENHALSVSHRDKTGIPEMHEKQTDIFVVQSGEAVLLLGGEIEGMKTETPGEIRGASIKNGVRKSVSAGDVVRIPAKMPHQFFLEPGKQITYFVVKVNSL